MIKASNLFLLILTNLKWKFLKRIILNIYQISKGHHKKKKKKKGKKINGNIFLKKCFKKWIYFKNINRISQMEYIYLIQYEYGLIG
jgi:hypothetical protein